MNTLSGGERQMAFIAAALAQGTEILLLDEPSTFLDYRHQAAVAALLKSACRESGITVVAVHHDVNTATDCSDRIYAIKEGSIAFEGPPQDIADPDILAGIYGTGFTLIPSDRSTIPVIVAGGGA
jgi:iron complex transport system ATP-binding protein